MSYMKFGILGCRHPHIEIFIQEMLELGHQFIGICETDLDIARNLADKYKVAIINDEEEFFELEPDIVGTSSVNNEKINVIESCRNHGVHVISDKPIVTNMDDYKRLKDIMDEGNIEIGLMLTERFNPPIYTLWKMIKDGVLGDIISISSLKPHKLNEKNRAAWHFSKVQNGGIVVDLLIHDFDLVRWLTGSDIEEINGFVKKSLSYKYPDFYDSVHAITRMKNGVIASLEADWWTPDAHWNWGNGRIFCTGTLGKAEIYTTGDNNHNEPYGIVATNDNDSRIFANNKPHITLTQDFLNRIAGAKDVIITREDILNATLDTLIADSCLKVI